MSPIELLGEIANKVILDNWFRIRKSSSVANASPMDLSTALEYLNQQAQHIHAVEYETKARRADDSTRTSLEFSRSIAGATSPRQAESCLSRIAAKRSLRQVHRKGTPAPNRIFNNITSRPSASGRAITVRPVFLLRLHRLLHCNATIT